MKKVKDVLEERPISTYKGSEKTLEFVVQAIKDHEQLGAKYADNFDPYHDAMTFGAWKRQGYIPGKGAIGIKSITFVESEDPKTGERKMIRRTVILFHRSQVQILSPFKQKQTV